MENRIAMNEMKFRGRGLVEPNSGIWICGSLVNLSPKGKYIVKYDMTCDKEEFLPVLSTTVGLFTGLHDKNGFEVFTGDIVKCPKGRNDLIEFKNGSAWLRYRNITLHRFVNELEQTIEVIGNIHENEDLL